MFLNEIELSDAVVKSIQNATDGQFYGYYNTLSKRVKGIFTTTLGSKMPPLCDSENYPSEWDPLSKAKFLTVFDKSRVISRSLNHSNYLDMSIGATKFDDDEGVMFRNLANSMSKVKDDQVYETRQLVGPIVVGEVEKVKVGPAKASAAEKIVICHDQKDGMVRNLAVKFYTSMDIKCDWTERVENGIGDKYKKEVQDDKYMLKLVTAPDFNPRILVSENKLKPPVLNTTDLSVIEKRYDLITQGHATKTYLASAGCPRPWMTPLVSWAGVAKALGYVDKDGVSTRIKAGIVYGVDNHNIVNCFEGAVYYDNKIVVAPVPSNKLSPDIKARYDNNFPEVISSNILDASFEEDGVVMSNVWDKKFGLSQVKQLLKILAECKAVVRFKCKFSILIEALDYFNFDDHPIYAINVGRPYIFEVFLSSIKPTGKFETIELTASNFAKQLTQIASHKVGNMLIHLTSLKTPIHYSVIHHRIDVVIPNSYWPLRVNFKSIKGNESMDGIALSDLASVFATQKLLEFEENDKNAVIAQIDDQKMEGILNNNGRHNNASTHSPSPKVDSSTVEQRGWDALDNEIVNFDDDET